ncbi:MAG: citrate lyase holo-[acyl-carrier protein] synthase, partial [Leuconostoc falkenbergense]
MDYFEGGERLNLIQVLDNREWREKYQKQLMASFPTAVITSVKLNLPGPIKTSPKLQSVFQNIINDLN